jgi:methionyl-tRNA synthetase
MHGRADFYANGGVHIGHLAGVYVPADIYVRYLRLKKQPVVFIGGSDEHGVPITIRAKKEGVITPQDVCDRYHKIIKDSFKEFGISFDIYSRTTSKVHNKFASDFFRKLYDDGKLIEKESEQYYDPRLSSSSPTATSWVHALTAATPTPMATSARNAAATSPYGAHQSALHHQRCQA